MNTAAYVIYIKNNMKKLIYPYLIVAALCLSSCTAELPSPTESDSPSIDPTRTVEVTLGGITLYNSSAAPSSRAGASLPLPEGETFRLYAFERGKTDMQELLVTRAYTITGSAGTPTLNPGEKPLYLPLGQVDIYLVGPLSTDVNKGQVDKEGNPLPPQVIEVATEYSVRPTHGVDLIASKTELTVEAGSANTFNAHPLAHKMALVEFCLQAPSTANYENLLLKDVKLYKQVKNGVFVFGADGGTITPSTGAEDIQTFTVIEEEKGKVYRTLQYMIPRPHAELKVEVRFSCNLIGMTDVIDKRLTSGLLEVALTAGKRNYFYSNPIIATEIKWRMKLLPWNNVTVPEDVYYDGVLLALRGEDAPETINGKLCWRDRSGQGNHAQLFGNVQHNTNRYILPGGTGNYLKLLKSLGKNQSYTIEFVVRGASTTASTTLFHFASTDDVGTKREFACHYPWTSEGIWFDSPWNNGLGADNRLNIRPVSSLPFPMTNLNQWQVIRRPGLTNGYEARMNGRTVVTMTASTPLGEMLHNYIGCFANKTGPFAGDLCALRMYNRVLTNEELTQNLQSDKTNYKF